MAEIRCPSCGALNPKDSEICKSCGTDYSSHPSSAYPSFDSVQRKDEAQQPDRPEENPKSNASPNQEFGNGKQEPIERESKNWIDQIRTLHKAETDEKKYADLSLRNDHLIEDSISLDGKDEQLDSPGIMLDRNESKVPRIENQRSGEGSKETNNTKDENDFKNLAADVEGSAYPKEEGPNGDDALTTGSSQGRIRGKPEEFDERQGPLAGLENILPPEPQNIQYKLPSINSTSLQVSPKEKEQAGIIQELFSKEADISTIQENPAGISHRILHWLIALFMIIGTGFGLIFNNTILPAENNTLISNEIQNVLGIINQLPKNSTVLVGFDYEPALAGEMKAAAAALIDKLIRKGSHFILVSTIPTGPAIAENFVQSTQRSHNLTSGVQYINLGFIPGGEAGLLQFAQSPQEVFPLSYTGVDPWKTRFLEGVTSISDFDLVVLMSGDPDTAKMWIEQIQPIMGNTSLLTVLSAQAEPMTRPYYGSEIYRQINGSISGIIGGTAFETAVRSQNIGSSYYRAFGYGVFVSIVSISIGGIFSLYSWIQRGGDDDFSGRKG